MRWQLARKSPLDLERTRVRGQLLSIFFCFSICYVAKWVCPIFFLVWAESRKITKLDLVCLGTMGCSKIMRRENWWFERDKRKRKEFGPNYGLSMILNLLRFLFSLCEERKLMVWAKRGYDDFCDIYVETLLFCGPDYDEINKTSLSLGLGSITSNPWQKLENRHELCSIVTLSKNVMEKSS